MVTGSNSAFLFFAVALPGISSDLYTATCEKIMSGLIWTIVIGTIIEVALIVYYFQQRRYQQDLASEEMRGNIEFLNRVYWSRIRRRRGR